MNLQRGTGIFPPSIWETKTSRHIRSTPLSPSVPYYRHIWGSFTPQLSPDDTERRQFPGSWTQKKMSDLDSPQEADWTGCKCQGHRRLFPLLPKITDFFLLHLLLSASWRKNWGPLSSLKPLNYLPLCSMIFSSWAFKRGCPQLGLEALASRTFVRVIFVLIPFWGVYIYVYLYRIYIYIITDRGGNKAL